MQTAVRQMLCPKHHVLPATTQAETMARISGWFLTEEDSANMRGRMTRHGWPVLGHNIL